MVKEILLDQHVLFFYKIEEKHININYNMLLQVKETKTELSNI